MNAMIYSGALVVAMAWTGSAAAAPSCGAGPVNPAVVNGAVGGPGIRLAARQSRVDESGEVKFTVAASTGEATLVAEAPGVRFEKRFTADRVWIRVETAADMIEFEADTAGVVRLARPGKSRRFRMGVKPEARVQQAQDLTAGSAALMAFESLASVLEASERPEAQSVVTSYALVQSVRGGNAPARDLARRIRNRAKVPAVRVAFGGRSGDDARDCWSTYEYTVTVYSYELEACQSAGWWNPFQWSACNFEYTLKSELAFFGVISCSGGLPI